MYIFDTEKNKNKNDLNSYIQDGMPTVLEIKSINAENTITAKEVDECIKDTPKTIELLYKGNNWRMKPQGNAWTNKIEQEYFVDPDFDNLNL